MADEIRLVLPRRPEFGRVASFVLGGLAVRLNLTVEGLEDVQLAVDTLLSRVEGPAGVVTVWLVVRGGALVARVGPLEDRLLEELGQEPGDALGVRRVLDSTVDEVLVEGEWVVLTKAVGVAR